MGEQGQITERMTADQIQAAIEDLAQNGDGADRRWALAKLEQRSQGTSFGKPESLSDVGVVDRMIPLFLAAGRDLVTIAFSKAFRLSVANAKKMIDKTKVEEIIDPTNIQIDVNNLPETLRQFNRRFGIKRKGMPPGFPQGKSVLAKREWVRRESMKIIMEREREKMKEARIADQSETEESEAL